MRHKKINFIKSDSCENCYELVMIHRQLKPKSSIRRVMWKAHNAKWVASIDKKYNTNG